MGYKPFSPAINLSGIIRGDIKMISESKFQLGMSQKEYIRFSMLSVFSNKIFWVIMSPFLLLYILVFIAYFDIHIYQSYVTAIFPLLLLFMVICISSFRYASLAYEDLSNRSYYIDSRGIGYNNPNGRQLFIPWCDITLIKEEVCFYKIYKNRILLLEIHRTGLNSNIQKIIHESLVAAPVTEKKLIGH